MGATLGWGSGRQLTSYTKGSNNITYTYDADGLRASKTVNGVKTTYLYSNGLLVYQKQYKANHTDIDMHFWYNANGHLAAVEYFNNINDTWVLAYALTNSMGDVIGLYYGNGNLVTTYEYDAWGNLVYMNDTSALGVGTLNPIRYRSYYYDTDTGFYYCQSRYYNPQVGRFINADSQLNTDAILGFNMFAYSYNNPINLKDNGGNRPISALSVVSETAEERADSFAYMNKGRVSKSPKPSFSGLTTEQKHFVSVIAGEAIGANEKTQKAVAHTIMNRVKEPRDVWSNATSVTDVLVFAQYNAVGSSQYKKCMNYLETRDGNNAGYESLISAVIPIYSGSESDFTGGAHYIFNIHGSAGLLKALESQPSRYTKCGPFDGISDTEYRMYRCEW